MKKPSLNEILEQWEKEKTPEEETNSNKWEDDIPQFVLEFPDFEKLEEKNELKHHGILGQKWGVRRWQEEDGSYNEEGLERYFGHRKGKTSKTVQDKDAKKGNETVRNKDTKNGHETAKKILIAAGAIGVTALAGYGIYKYVGYKETLKQLKVDIPIEEKVLIKEPIGEAFESLSAEKIEETIEEHAEVLNSSLPSRMKILEMIKNGDYSKNPSSLFDEEAWNSLSDEERRSIQFYTTHDGYRICNGILRGNDKEFIMKNAHNPMLADVMLNDGYGEQLINSLKGAIDKSPLKQDVTTYRGINTDTLPKFLNMSDEDFSKINPKSLCGLIVSDSGFYSSSPVIGNAEDFAKAADHIVNKSDTGVVITTICKKGTKGIYIGGKSEAPWEKELLLNSEQKFRILDYESNESGKIKGLVVEALID